MSMPGELRGDGPRELEPEGIAPIVIDLPAPAENLEAL